MLSDKPDVALYASRKNVGAGRIRNLGIRLTTSDHILFLDADDVINVQTLKKWIHRLKTDSSDLIFFGYELLREGSSAIQGPFQKDQRIIDETLKGDYESVINLRQSKKLLKFSNYPWNKIVRKSLLTKSTEPFSSTKVHNDILAHWKVLTGANQIQVTKDHLVVHRIDSPDSLTNQNGLATRTDMYTALRDVRNYLNSSYGAGNEFCHTYWGFARDLHQWNLDKMTNFDEQAQLEILRFGLTSEIEFSEIRQILRSRDSHLWRWITRPIGRLNS